MSEDDLYTAREVHQLVVSMAKELNCEANIHSVMAAVCDLKDDLKQSGQKIKDLEVDVKRKDERISSLEYRLTSAEKAHSLLATVTVERDNHLSSLLQEREYSQFLRRNVDSLMSHVDTLKGR